MLVDPLRNNVAKATVAARILVEPNLVAFAEYVWARSNQEHTLEPDSCNKDGNRTHV